MDMIDEIKNRVKGLVDDAETLKTLIKDAEQWNSLSEVTDNIGMFSDFVLNVILSVEMVTKEIETALGDVASAKEKKEAVVKFVDDIIKLPWYLEAVDGAIISVLIDLLVDQLNKFFGHNWDLSVITKVLEDGKAYISTLKKMLDLTKGVN